MFPSPLALSLLLIGTPQLGDNQYPLWDGRAPATVGSADANFPFITVYYPDGQPNGTAVIVLPGGGYQALATDGEGQQPALWLNARGVTAFVLEYRVVEPGRPAPLHPTPLLDVQRAIRVVRFNAKAFGVDPNQIGVWGFSAGGHLASVAATHFDAGNPGGKDPIEKVSSRPDFAIMAYPMIFLGKGANSIVQRNLIGNSTDPTLIAFYSSDKRVTPQTPPCFLFHTVQDQVVPVEHSRRFWQACQKQGVSVEYVELMQGPHGIGLGTAYPELLASKWTGKLEEWLGQEGLLDAPKPKATIGGASSFSSSRLKGQ